MIRPSARGLMRSIGPLAAAAAASPERIGVIAVLGLPLAYLYSRVGAEILMGVIDTLFFVRCAQRRDWHWTAAPWFVLALLWWAWLVVCSAPIPGLAVGEGGGRSLLQAVLLVRYFVFSAALGTWLLTTPGPRRAALAALGVTAAWIIVQCWQQYAFGTDLFGWPRWIDGALTGPFRQPRAGPALILILFPAILPPTAALFRRRQRWMRLLGVAGFAVAIATMVLIGQRMPALLTALGLLACGIALPRLRPVVLSAGAVAAVLLLATPVVSRPTFQKLVVHFADQMHHFPQSPYGLLYTRAAVMGLANPVTGLGFDGFRDHCMQPAYQHGLPALGITDAQAAGPVGCSIHPHNHYLEAFTSGGWPGLLLFATMAATWLLTLGRGLLRAGPQQVGCFTGVLLALWPFASTSAFFTLPNAGWLFLVLGTGLAAATPLRASARNRLPQLALSLPH